MKSLADTAKISRWRFSSCRDHALKVRRPSRFLGSSARLDGHGRAVYMHGRLPVAAFFYTGLEYSALGALFHDERRSALRAGLDDGLIRRGEIAFRIFGSSFTRSRVSSRRPFWGRNPSDADHGRHCGARTEAIPGRGTDWFWPLNGVVENGATPGAKQLRLFMYHMISVQNTGGGFNFDLKSIDVATYPTAPGSPLQQQAVSTVPLGINPTHGESPLVAPT